MSLRWMMALEAATKNAYVEGYVNGVAHRRGLVLPKAKELADLWWKTIESRLDEQLAARRGQDGAA